MRIERRDSQWLEELYLTFDVGELDVEAVWFHPGGPIDAIELARVFETAAFLHIDGDLEVAGELEIAPGNGINIDGALRCRSLVLSTGVLHAGDVHVTDSVVCTATRDEMLDSFDVTSVSCRVWVGPRPWPEARPGGIEANHGLDADSFSNPEHLRVLARRSFDMLLGALEDGTPIDDDWVARNPADEPSETRPEGPSARAARAIHPTSPSESKKNNAMQFIPAPRPIAPQLTDRETKLLEQAEEHQAVRGPGEGLVAYMTFAGPPPPEFAHVLTSTKHARLVLSTADESHTFALLPGWKPSSFRPSRSGTRCLVYFKTKLSKNGVGLGHAVEYALDGAEQVVITATEYTRPPDTLWDLDYVGDDDHIAAILGEHLLLLVRNTDSGEFEEADSLPCAGTGLATAGHVIAINASPVSQWFGVVADRLVVVPPPELPATAGGIYASHDSDGPQICFFGPEASHVLDVGDDPLAGLTPTAAPEGVALRRVPGMLPRVISDEERDRRFKACWEEASVSRALQTVFVTKGGRVAARLSGVVNGQQRKDSVLSHPDGTVQHDQTPTLIYLSGHPTAERALGLDTGVVYEVDLETRARVALGNVSPRISYASVGDRELLMVHDQTSNRVTVYEHAPMTPVGEPVAETLYSGQWFHYIRVGANGFLQTIADGNAVRYELIQLVDDDAGLRFDSAVPLYLAGARCAGQKIVASVRFGSDSFVICQEWYFRA